MLFWGLQTKTDTLHRQHHPHHNETTDDFIEHAVITIIKKIP